VGDAVRHHFFRDLVERDPAGLFLRQVEEFF